MSGTLYGVSVGPGDPELMTVKACRVIRACGLIAYPLTAGPIDAGTREDSLAYRIAEQAVPELQEKKCEAVYSPMTRDRDRLAEVHKEGARKLETYLDQGTDIAFLTLGDVTLYSTFSYVQAIVEADGYKVRLISGVPSFCAVAARLGKPLVLGDESLVVETAQEALKSSFQNSENTTYVLMKTGKRLSSVKASLQAAGREGQLVENCGMESEKVYASLGEFPDRAGYFSTLIAKGQKTST
ncbi:MAG: precorrin-2 C(20)-methyltransferase [Lachnospiraceae bacterium]|nr:precorrin-2 C(20)-methyltransferase [Lachnospiraceae bacterium]